MFFIRVHPCSSVANKKTGFDKMKTKYSLIIVFSLLLLAGVCWAQDASLTISDGKIEPNATSPNGEALISCRVQHSEGPQQIEGVAAILFHVKRNTSYPRLYDDGTHGDRGAGDGVYSLTVQAPREVGEGRVVFSAIDKQRYEIESDPVFFTVK